MSLARYRVVLPARHWELALAASLRLLYHFCGREKRESRRWESGRAAEKAHDLSMSSIILNRTSCVSNQYNMKHAYSAQHSRRGPVACRPGAARSLSRPEEAESHVG